MKEAIGIKRLLQAPNHEKVYEEEEQVPEWVQMMYTTAYFSGCVAHADFRKNELDRFCINCRKSFCYNCLPDHALHKYVKIRKYVYREVINRQDLYKLFNCSGIQAYHTNKTKVLFLKQRSPQQPQQQQNEEQDTPPDSQAKKQKSTRFDHNCIVCSRSLQDATLYCSIECKVSALYQCEHKEKGFLDDNDPCKEKDDAVESGIQLDEEYVTIVSHKRQKHRKVVALRAPMF